MDGTIATVNGDVYVDLDVIAKYAGSAATECFGVVGMAAVSMKDGLSKLLRKDSLNHGVKVRVNENRITIDHSSGNEVIDHFLTCALYQVKTIEESYPVFVRVLERRPDEV